MVAYIDEFKDRFRVGPICRVLAASLDCGSVTPRGYRMFKSRPVSRMAARHEALARDILEIHADFFMAVYGYRKTHAQPSAKDSTASSRTSRPEPADSRTWATSAP